MKPKFNIHCLHAFLHIVPNGVLWDRHEGYKKCQRPQYQLFLAQFLNKSILKEDVLCTRGCMRVRRHNDVHPPQSCYLVKCMLWLCYQGPQKSIACLYLDYGPTSLEHTKSSLHILLATFFILLNSTFSFHLEVQVWFEQNDSNMDTHHHPTNTTYCKETHSLRS